MNNIFSSNGNFVNFKKIILLRIKHKADSHQKTVCFFYGRISRMPSKGQRTLLLELLQSYLWENKTVKGGLLMESPLSVYSDWKINLTNTH